MTADRARTNRPTPPIDCYLASVEQPPTDPWLAQLGFCGGTISFAVPEFGLQFRCRVAGQLIVLEYAAFLTLLRTIATQLKKQKIKAITVHSSNPAFVATPPVGGQQSTSDRKARQVRKLLGNIKASVLYIAPIQNRALFSPVDLPGQPVDSNMSQDLLKLKDMLGSEPIMRPFQKGLRF